MKWILPLVFALAVVSCAGEQPVGELQTDCPKTHPSVGKTADFETLFHSVDGIATIVDDCTIRIDNFDYDGGGIVTQVYGFETTQALEDSKLLGTLPKGVVLTEDLYGTVYNDHTLTIKLPHGTTLDDVKVLSVWCVSARENFGHAVFN